MTLKRHHMFSQAFYISEAIKRLCLPVRPYARLNVVGLTNVDNLFAKKQKIHTDDRSWHRLRSGQRIFKKSPANIDVEF